MNKGQFLIISIIIVIVGLVLTGCGQNARQSARSQPAIAAPAVADSQPIAQPSAPSSAQPAVQEVKDTASQQPASENAEVSQQDLDQLKKDLQELNPEDLNGFAG